MFIRHMYIGFIRHSLSDTMLIVFIRHHAHSVYSVQCALCLSGILEIEAK